MYQVVCETMPEPLAVSIESLEEAKKVARTKAEEVWNDRGVSLYCRVKDTDYRAYFAVRYTPSNGGTYHVRVEYANAS